MHGFKKPFGQYSIVGLFGSAASPVISYLAFGMGFPLMTGVLLGYTIGIILGILLPPLAAQFLHFHQGFSLYNIGFATGIVTMFFTSFTRLFGRDITEQTYLTTEYSSFYSSFVRLMRVALFNRLFIESPFFPRIGSSIRCFR